MSGKMRKHQVAIFADYGVRNSYSWRCSRSTWISRVSRDLMLLLVFLTIPRRLIGKEVSNHLPEAQLPSKA
jgi:hypothetical protein